MRFYGTEYDQRESFVLQMETCSFLDKVDCNQRNQVRYVTTVQGVLRPADVSGKPRLGNQISESRN